MRFIAYAFLGVSTAVLLAAGCGGKATTGNGDGGPGGAGGGGGTRGSGGTGGHGGSGGSNGSGADGGMVSCPSALPTAGQACSQDGLACEYGADPRETCRESASCSGGTWSLTAPGCPPYPTATCPPSLSSAQGASCSPTGAYCVYDQGLSCQCTTCPNPYPICMTTPPQWACDTANTTPSCPAAIPNYGTACSPEGTNCSYGCEMGTSRICKGGLWVAASPPGGCPVSTRAAKKDIRYLSPTEKEELAEEVDRIPLATYEYTDPVRAGSRHLGFILEDNPVPFGEDAEHNQVDLYGYTSTLVAALQAQSKRIEALELEVRSLRERPRSLPLPVHPSR